MVDRYTKVVLTIIAAALMLIAGRMALPGSAEALDPACGDRMNPCWVAADPALNVYITTP